MWSFNFLRLLSFIRQGSLVVLLAAFSSGALVSLVFAQDNIDELADFDFLEQPASDMSMQDMEPEVDMESDMISDMEFDIAPDTNYGPGGVSDDMIDVEGSDNSGEPVGLLMPDTADLSVPPSDIDVDAVSHVDSGVPVIPSLPVEEDIDDNLFFDAEALVPTGEMGRKGAPRKLSPRLDPASKLIVVRKNHAAGSREAKLVAADRALQLGRYDSALVIYDNLYLRNKRNPNILMGRAITLQHLGRGEAAVRAYEQLLDLRPENVEAQVNMLGLLGQRYPEVALRRLIDLRNKNPNNMGVVAQIAIIQAELGRYDDALQYLGLVSSMEPNNANHIFNMAVVADRAGSKIEAVRYYEQALEVDTIYGGGHSIPRDAVFERLARLR